MTATPYHLGRETYSQLITEKDENGVFRLLDPDKNDELPAVVSALSGDSQAIALQ